MCAPVAVAAQEDTGVRTGAACDDSTLADTRVVAGHVRDLLTEQPMPGMSVILRSTRFADRVLAVTQTDGRGTFRFCAVPAIAGIALQAQAERSASEPELIPSGRRWEGSLYIEWSVPIDLAGRVVDAVTGAPIEGATITVDGRGARSTSQTDGVFRIAGQGAGRVSLTTSAVGYATRTDTLSTTSGDALDLELRMSVDAFELAPILVRARSTEAFEELTSGSRFDVMTLAEVDSVLPRVMGFNSLLRSAQFPGLQVSEGQAGAVCVQAHRGGSSLAGGCNMVEVFLDGVRLHASEHVLATLEPGIVESMQFMDPLEAGVRFTGPRVNNGVLIITTRHGTRRPR